MTGQAQMQMGAVHHMLRYEVYPYPPSTTLQLQLRIDHCLLILP